MSKLESLWKPTEKMECLELGNHFLLVRFHSPCDMAKVLNEGPWFIGPHYIAIRKWEPEFDTGKAKTSTSVVWVRLPGLPIEFYDKAILCKIGAEIGKLLKIDFRTEKNEKVRFARLCVQVDLSIALTSRVRVGNYIQKISYEGIPSICFKCGLSGHKIQNCSPAPPIQKPDIASEEAKFGDWMLVTNKNRYRKKVSNPIKEVLKPEGHNTQGRWQRRNTGNPVSAGTKVTIPNGSSSSSQTQTNPNPKGLTSAILCPVAIDPVSTPAVVSQPLLSTIADTAPKALASAMLPPANSPLNTEPPRTKTSESLFSPNNTLAPPLETVQPLQSNLSPLNAIPSSMLPDPSLSTTLVTQNSVEHGPSSPPKAQPCSKPHSHIKSSPNPKPNHLSPIHILKRPLPPSLSPKPDLPICNSAAAIHPPVSESDPCGNPSATLPPTSIDFPLPGGPPTGILDSEATHCSTSANVFENPKPALCLSRVLQSNRIRNVLAPGEAKPNKSGSKAARVQTRSTTPKYGGSSASPTGGDKSGPKKPCQ